MTAGSVVLVPPPPGDEGIRRDEELAASLGAALRHQAGQAAPPVLRPRPPVAPADGGRWLTHVSAALHRSLHGTAAGTPTAGPLLLVGAGGAGLVLPGLGFALHAARRSVAGYVLVESALPPVGGEPGSSVDWPDAPVTYLLATDAAEEWRSAALQARLRGWTVATVDAAVDGDGIAAAVAAVVLAT